MNVCRSGSVVIKDNMNIAGIYYFDKNKSEVGSVIQIKKIIEGLNNCHPLLRESLGNPNANKNFIGRLTALNNENSKSRKPPRTPEIKF